MTPRRCLAAAVATALLGPCASTASAADLATDTVADPVTVSAGGGSLGTMSFNVSFDGGHATGVVRSGSLRLASGRTFRLQACIWAKAPGAAPESQCTSKIVDPDFLQSLTGTAGPGAELVFARPAAGAPSATIAGSLLLDVRNASGEWVSYASSWPAAGMPAAGVAVPAVDETSGAVLGPQGTPLPGVRPGGINTGAPDSICAGTDTTSSAPPQGSTDVLGDLPAPYEVQEPLGKYSGARSHGVMILLHGGTWQMHGRGVMESTRADADRWQARGWRTVMGDYRPCGDSIGDVLALFDRVRQVYGAARPICVSGQSSGGQLALLLAALRPEVACVISQAGPADLTTLATQAATKPDGTPSALIPVQLANVTVSAFGADRQAQVSPTRLGVAGRTLFAIAASDPGIPWAQASGFAAAQKARSASSYVDLMRLASGSASWVHADVSPAALASFHQHEKLLTDPLIRGEMTVSRSVRARSLKRRGVSVTYTCPGACTVRAELMLGRHAARVLELRTRIGSRSAHRKSYGTSAVTVRLAAKARRQIRKGTTMRVVLSMLANHATRHFAATVRLR